MLTVGAHALFYLGRELAGWRENQDAYPVGRSALARFGRARGGRGTHQALQDWQHEGRCLAGARLGTGKQVRTGEHDRDGLALNRSGLGISGVGDSAHKRIGQTEVFKRHGKTF